MQRRRESERERARAKEKKTDNAQRGKARACMLGPAAFFCISPSSARLPPTRTHTRGISQPDTHPTHAPPPPPRRPASRSLLAGQDRGAKRQRASSAFLRAAIQSGRPSLLSCFGCSPSALPSCPVPPLIRTQSQHPSRPRLRAAARQGTPVPDFSNSLLLSLTPFLRFCL